MEEINTIILENKEEYNIVDTIKYNDVDYYLLSNTNNLKDICIRKIIIEDTSYVCRLDNDELRTIYAMFLDKNRNLIEE